MRVRHAVIGVIVPALVLLTGAWTSPATAVVQRGTTTQTATQFYMGYLAAFAKATKVEDLYPYMIAKNVDEAKKASDTDRTQMFGFIKMVANTDVKVLKEDHQPDGSVILTCEGTDSDKKKATGKVTIAKEGGAWKLSEESWSS